MRILFEITHTGCDRETMRSADLDFDAYHPKGWNHRDRPKPENARIVHGPAEFRWPYDVAVVGNETILRYIPPEIPVVWKCLTDYGRRQLSPGILERISAWVAASQETADRWGMFGHPKARVIEHGIDSDIFAGYDGTVKSVLSVGNLLPIRPEKGPETLRAVGEKLHLDIVGFGNDGIGQPGRIRVVEAQEDVWALAKMYRIHAVYFNPCSVIVCAVLEAMATGMPVVTMRPGNFKDLMRHRENCFIADDYADAIYWLDLLLKNPSLGREIGAKARESVRFRFHPAICAFRWRQVLLEAAGEKKGG